jgi:hypothetical protein
MVVNQDSNYFCTIKYLIQTYLTQCIQLQEPELALKEINDLSHKYRDV